MTSTVHIHAPPVIETRWTEEPKRRLKVKTYCCHDKKRMKDCRIKTEFFEWYGPTVTFWCKGECNPATKRDMRRTATVWHLD